MFYKELMRQLSPQWTLDCVFLFRKENKWKERKIGFLFVSLFCFLVRLSATFDSVDMSVTQHVDVYFILWRAHCIGEIQSPVTDYNSPMQWALHKMEYAECTCSFQRAPVCDHHEDTAALPLSCLHNTLMSVTYRQHCCVSTSWRSWKQHLQLLQQQGKKGQGSYPCCHLDGWLSHGEWKKARCHLAKWLIVILLKWLTGRIVLVIAA